MNCFFVKFVSNKKIMKKSFNILFLSGFIGLLVFSCQNPEAKTSSTDSNDSEILAENKASVDMKVDGMVCAMGCAKFIEEKVSELDGVVLSQVNFEEETAHFEFDKSNTSAAEIENFINDIHDGQYSAKITTKSESNVEEETETVEETKSVSSVSESLNFSFPELFTYFLRRI